MVYVRDLSRISAADMAVLEGLISSDWPDIWADFARVFFCGLLASEELAAPRDALARVAVEQVLVMGFQLGGSQPYIPRGVMITRRLDWERIRREFTGNNYGELAARYDLSASRIRQIVNQKPTASAKVVPVIHRIE